MMRICKQSLPPCCLFVFVCLGQTIRDLGANFYLSEAAVLAGTPRAEACIADLKSLNPYCKVDVWEHEASAAGVDAYCKSGTGTGKPLSAIVVTRLLPKAHLLELNEVSWQ